MNYPKLTRNERKKGRPKIKEKNKKSNIYSERMILTLTPQQKMGLEKLSKQFENSMTGYLRHLINEQIRMNGA